MVSRVMRRGIRVHAAFAPTRLSDEHLRGAYEHLVPIVEKAVKVSSERASPMVEQQSKSRRKSQ